MAVTAEGPGPKGERAAAWQEAGDLEVESGVAVLTVVEARAAAPMVDRPAAALEAATAVAAMGHGSGRPPALLHSQAAQRSEAWRQETR